MVDVDDPAVSDELFALLPHGVEICYQTYGAPTGRPLLLIMGLGGPMTWWPHDLCVQLARDGFFVIRYDNRDTGRSTRFNRHRVTQGDLLKAFLGRKVFVPYSLHDLADDGAGLLEHLGIDSAHVAGVSMGGMIAQTMVLDHPDRVRSLTSIMSSTGRRTVGYQHPSLLPHLLRRAARGRDGYIEASVEFWRRISSPGFPTTEEVARVRAQETWDRGISFSGVTRQMVAVLTQRDRTAALAGVTVPTSVLHGLADKMVHVSGGRTTAQAVPGSRLTLVSGMGHDLPPGLFDTFVEEIRSAADKADHLSAEAPPQTPPDASSDAAEA